MVRPHVEQPDTPLCRRGPEALPSLRWVNSAQLTSNVGAPRCTGSSSADGREEQGASVQLQQEVLVTLGTAPAV